ncbi:hypothetical protein ACF0H5_003663 [Mactra antiquata]
MILLFWLVSIGDHWLLFTDKLLVLQLYPRLFIVCMNDDIVMNGTKNDIKLYANTLVKVMCIMFCDCCYTPINKVMGIVYRRELVGLSMGWFYGYQMITC